MFFDNDYIRLYYTTATATATTKLTVFVLAGLLNQPFIQSYFRLWGSYPKREPLKLEQVFAGRMPYVLHVLTEDAR